MPIKRSYVDLLETNNFIAVERSGREWRIRRGSRALAALNRTGYQT